MVQTSEEERRKVRDQSSFVLDQIEPEHPPFKITQLTSRKKYAQLRADYEEKAVGHQMIQDQEIKLGINFGKFRKTSDAKRLVILVHEATHIKYPHHKRIFWTELADNIEHIIGADFKKYFEADRHEIYRQAVLNVKNVDNRQTTMIRMMNMLNESFGKPVNLWEEILDKRIVRIDEKDLDVYLPFENLTFTEKSGRKIAAWFKPGMKYGRYFRVSPIQVNQRAETLRERDDLLASLYFKAGRPKAPIWTIDN